MKIGNGFSVSMIPAPALAFSLLLLPALAHCTDPKPNSLGTRPMSDTEVAALMVNETLSQFKQGDCPCPYSQTKMGDNCGANSLYIRNRGRGLKCYIQDAHDYDIKQYRIRYDIPPVLPIKPAETTSEPVKTFN